MKRNWFPALLAIGAFAFFLLWIEGRRSGYAPGTSYSWDCERTIRAQELCLRRP